MSDNMIGSGFRVHPSEDMASRTETSGSTVQYGSAAKTLKRQTLEEAFWSDRQRRTGLQRRSKAEPTENDEYKEVR